MGIRLIEAADQLGIGGTERALENYCRYIDKSRFEITVVGFREGGVRADILRSEGFKVVIADMNEGIWENAIRRADVLHWHGDGHLDPAIFESVRRFKPKVVIQTNVFGLADRSSYYDLIDLDLYISKMCLVKRVREDGEWGTRYQGKRAVLYNPVDVDRIWEDMPSAADVQHFRKDLGLGKFPVIGCVGRPVDELVDPAAFQMMCYLQKWIPEVRFLQVGVTQGMRRLVKKLKLEDHFVFMEPTLDLKTLLKYYRSIDVYLSASRIGHTFGMNIAEAMSCGLPIVAVSTPRANNAQVELVDNGLNGLVIEAYPRLVALACRELLLDSQKRAVMGRAATRKVIEYSARRIVGILENVVHEVLEEGSSISRSNLHLISWSPDLESEYTKRLGNLYAKPNLNDRSRVWVRKKAGGTKLKMLRLLRRYSPPLRKATDVLS